ncbi:hypothetical protein MKZ38_001731 [Zalerion maritima]|uniref:Chromo domain-containing protein n=1 Tax=Zalerion maritima TaxID=339359 RepID=A0AAD5RRB4_9PEZI|nr:hypothetical protein MKZ38_001731 [Zalerion maritima]
MNRQKQRRSPPPPRIPPLQSSSPDPPRHHHPEDHQNPTYPHPSRRESVAESEPKSDPAPASETDTSREWYAIKRVVDERTVADGGKEYLVEWESFEGRKPDPAEWVSEDSLTKEAFEKWRKTVPTKGKKKGAGRAATRGRLRATKSPLPVKESEKRQTAATPDLLNSSTEEGQSVGPETPSTAGFAPGISANVVIEVPANSELEPSEFEYIPPTQSTQAAEARALISAASGSSQATKSKSSEASSIREPDELATLLIVHGSDKPNPDYYQDRVIPDSQEFTQDTISTLGHQIKVGGRAAEPSPDLPSHQPNQLSAPVLGLSFTIGTVNSTVLDSQEEAFGRPVSVEAEEAGEGSVRSRGRGQAETVESTADTDTGLPALSDTNPGPEEGASAVPGGIKEEAVRGSRGHGERSESATSGHEADTTTAPETLAQSLDSGEIPGTGESEYFNISQAAQLVESENSLPPNDSLGANISTLLTEKSHQERTPYSEAPLLEKPHPELETSQAEPFLPKPTPQKRNLGFSAPHSPSIPLSVMDGSVTNSPLSALEQMRRLRQQAYNQTDPVLPSSEPQRMDLGQAATISPADIMPPTAADQAATFMSQAPAEIPMPSLSMSQLQHGTGLNLVLGQDADLPQQTVSPADINPTLGAEALSVAPASHPENTASPSPSDDIEPSIPSHLALVDSSIQTEYLVTLPFQASRRSVYVSLHSEYQQALKDINTLNASETPASADTQLLTRIDKLFEELLNVCDLPDMTTGLLEMPYHDQKMHAVQTNCKFSFIYELLQHIREFERTVLIICREGPVFDLLCAVLETAGCKFIIHEEKEALDGLEDPTIILVSSDQDVDGITTDFDCVVEFDYSCRNSELARKVRAIRNSNGRFPLILTLVVNYSLEHIYRKLSPPEPMDEVFYKSAIAIALYNCLPYLKNPRRGYHEPPELGITFGELLRNPDNDIDWSPVPIPEEVMDFFSSQQPGSYAKPSTQREQSARPSIIGGRKRQLDDADDDSSKRVKLVMRDGASQAESLAQLEKSAEKDKITLKAKAESENWYKKRCTDLRAQVESRDKFIRNTAKQHHAALKDRGKFEQQAKMALEKLKEAEETAEKMKSIEKNAASMHQEIVNQRDLMTGHVNPDIAQFATLQKKLQELEERFSKAERSAENARTDLEFAREQYQNASRRAGELAARNDELEVENKDLSHKASDNLRHIHEINMNMQHKELQNMLKQRDAMIADRDGMIQRLEETVAALRANQGARSMRETRQSSVPRSPRLGVGGIMSPRPVVPSSRTIPGAGSSRGGSPAPGSGIGNTVHDHGGHGHAIGSGMQPGGRWTHLRD